MRGQVLTPDNVSRIEFTFGKIVKHYPEEVVYEDDRFILPLSQEDTFKLGGLMKYQARIQFKDGSVKGTPVCKGMVYISVSKEVLS